MSLHAVLPARLSEEIARRKLWPVLPRRRIAPPAGPSVLALSFDLDYQADTDALPALTDLVDAAGAKMTLFAIGKLAQADPAAYADAHARGHEIANHTWSHPDNPVLNPDREFWHLSEDEMADEIARGQDALAAITGTRPVGFRTPHFKDAAPLRAALRRFPEIRYASSSLASRCPAPVPFVPEAAPRHGDQSLNFPAASPEADDLLMIPLTPCPGVRWSPFSSYLSIRRPANPAKGAGLHDLEKFETLWRRMLDEERARGFASVYFDPLDVMRDAETVAVFRRMLDHARDSGWHLTTLAEVERLWRPVAAP
ncbi:polysaccharide deacetylase family protein [Citreimonas sp.]|uniref:polysaccharide deacetylase family protein n=1 Tax=Citreimonas sp. TaxID=3036715 RepID=UPI00405842F7